MMIRLRQIQRRLQDRLVRLRPSKTTIIRPEGAAPGSFQIGLVIPAHNRPEYLGRMLEHLAASVLDNAIVAIVDDASSSAATRDLIRHVSLGDVPVVRVFRTPHRGYSVHEALRDGWDLLAGEYKCRLLVNLDSDTVMKPEWLQRLVTVFRRERAAQGPLIVTGFNTRQHGVISDAPDFRVKSSIGGLNMCFDAELYRAVVRPNLRYEAASEVGWDWYVVREMRARGYPFLCVRPSVIQHVGIVGRFSRPDSHDVADDY
jgi:cellulose synthase/poly-beta-1,6-N-acetylglucosamine synthase-like glycosyltransferase